MKTHNNLFQEICKFENLYSAYLKARRGKNGTAEVLEFTYNLENELLKLQHELKSHTYRTGKYRHFIILEPKERRISALPFRDRVIHHAICNIIEPILDKTFIYDCYACRKGKGTHAGADRIQTFIKKAKNCYALKCDISKYFPSVNHEILKQIIRKKIADKELLQLLDQIIDSPNSENLGNSDERQEIKNSEYKGLPIGNLTSQLFANMYLDKLDKYVKYTLKIKYYIRYMDDFVIMHESKVSLHELKEKVVLFLVSMRLTMHPKKAEIFPITLGIDFLGYRIFDNHRLVRKSTVKRFLKGVKIKLKEYDTNMIDFNKLMESFNSWISYMDYGNSYNLQKSLHERCFKNVM